MEVNLLAKYEDVNFIFLWVTQNVCSEDCKGDLSYLLCVSDFVDFWSPQPPWRVDGIIIFCIWETWYSDSLNNLPHIPLMVRCWARARTESWVLRCNHASQMLLFFSLCHIASKRQASVVFIPTLTHDSWLQDKFGLVFSKLHFLFFLGLWDW